MSKFFPHISPDSGFPGDDVRAYGQYRNTFDYQRWTAKTRITVMTVPWQYASGDEPYFKDAKARDDYFNRLGGESIDLDTMVDIIPDQSTKLPITYDRILTCNYLIADVPALPGDGGDLPNSTTGRKYYYHITGARRVNASVSAVMLQPDYWTTWQDDLTINRMDVERSHAALAMSADPGDYLKNPLANTAGLLAEEPDSPDDPVKISKTDYKTFGDGDLWALLAIRATGEQLKNMTEAGQGGTWTPPRFSDGGAPYGDWNTQYYVSDYNFALPQDLHGVTVPYAPAISSDVIRPNGWGMYAIEAGQLERFLGMARDHYPQLYQMIGACLVVPASLIRTGDSVCSLDGAVLRQVWAQEQPDIEISLKPDDFDYPDHYKDLTKLYTWPYSCLVIEGDDSRAVIRVETLTDAAALRTLVSIAYPYCAARRFLIGAGSGLTAAYEWRDIRGDAHTDPAPYNGFRQALQDVRFPCFELTADNQTIQNLNRFNSLIDAARANAINSYHSSAAGANTGRANAGRSAHTAHINTNRTTATGVDNTARGASTGVANTQRSSAASVANTETSIASATQQLSRSQSGQETAREINVSQGNAMTSLANSVTAQTTAADNQATTSQTAVNMTTSGISALANMVGNAASGNVGGAIGSAIGGAAQMAGQAVSASISVNLASKKAAISVANNNNTTSVNQDSQNSMINTQWNVNNDNNNTSNNAARTQINRTAATANTNASASAATANANAGASAATSYQNATDIENTTVGNANVSRQAALFAAQNSLSNTQNSVRAMVDDLGRGRNTVIAQASGDPLPDIMRTRATRVSVMTQPDAVVRSCGDDMCRHGYMYRMTLTHPDLMPMTRFAYWQGEPTITGKVPATAVEYIRGQFENGLTLWGDPDYIKDGIYGNERR